MTTYRPLNNFSNFSRIFELCNLLIGEDYELDMVSTADPRAFEPGCSCSITYHLADPVTGNNAKGVSPKLLAALNIATKSQLIIEGTLCRGQCYPAIVLKDVVPTLTAEDIPTIDLVAIRKMKS